MDNFSIVGNVEIFYEGQSIGIIMPPPPKLTDDPEYQRLFAPIEAGSPAIADKLVLADWLEENDHLVLAHAFRWMAGRNKRPHKIRERKTYPWVWIRNQARIMDSGISRLRKQAPFCVLPVNIFDIIHENLHPPAWQSFPTCQEGIDALANALEHIRKLHAVEP